MTMAAAGEPTNLEVARALDDSTDDDGDTTAADAYSTPPQPSTSPHLAADVRRLVELCLSHPGSIDPKRLLPTFETLLRIEHNEQSTTHRAEVMGSLAYMLTNVDVASRFVAGDDEDTISFCRAAADALLSFPGQPLLDRLATLCRCAGLEALGAIADAPTLVDTVIKGLQGSLGDGNTQARAVDVCAELAKVRSFRVACAQRGVVALLTPLLSQSSQVAEALRRLAAADATLALQVAVHARQLMDIARHPKILVAVRTCALAALAASLAGGAENACEKATIAVPTLSSALVDILSAQTLDDVRISASADTGARDGTTADRDDDEDSSEYETDDEEEDDEASGLLGLKAAAARALGSFYQHAPAESTASIAMRDHVLPSIAELLAEGAGAREMAAGVFFCECVARSRGAELISDDEAAAVLCSGMLRAMAAAGRELDPDDVNATAAAAESALRCLYLLANDEMVVASVVENASLTSEAIGTLLDECSYVRLRKLFPGLKQTFDVTIVGSTASATDISATPQGASSMVAESQHYASTLGENGNGDPSISDPLTASKDFTGNVVCADDDPRMLCAHLICQIAARLPDGCLARNSNVLSGLGGLLRGSGSTASELGRARSAACVAMWTLAESGPTNRRVMVRFSHKAHNKNESILNCLVDALRGPGAVSTIAAGALGALAQDVAVRSAVGATPGVIAALVGLLQNASDRFPCARILSALASLSLDSAVSARIAATPGALNALLACLQKLEPVDAVPLPSEETCVPSYAAAIIGNLAGHHASQPTVAGMASTLSKSMFAALAALENGGNVANFRPAVLGAVRNLALIPAARQEIAALPGSTEALLNLYSEAKTTEDSDADASADALAGLWLNLLSEPCTQQAEVLNTTDGGGAIARCLANGFLQASSDDDSCALRRRYYAMTLAAVVRYAGARHAVAKCDDLRTEIATSLHSDVPAPTRDVVVIASCLEVARRIFADPLCPALPRHHWIESIAGDAASLSHLASLLFASSTGGEDTAHPDEVAAMAAGLLLSVIRILAAEKDNCLLSLAPELRQSLLTGLALVLGSPAAAAPPNPSAAACAASALLELAALPCHPLRLALSELCFDMLYGCAIRADGPAACCSALAIFRLSRDPCALTEEQLRRLSSRGLVEAAARALPLTWGGSAKDVRRCFEKEAPWLLECGVFASPTVPWSADASLVMQRAATTPVPKGTEHLSKCGGGVLTSRIVSCLAENRPSKGAAAAANTRVTSAATPLPAAPHCEREMFRADAHAMAAHAAAAFARDSALAAQLCARAEDLFPALCDCDGTADAMRGCLSCLASLSCHDACQHSLSSYIVPYVETCLSHALASDDLDIRCLALGAARNLVFVDNRIWEHEPLRAAVIAALPKADQSAGSTRAPAPAPAGSSQSAVAVHSADVSNVTAQYAVEIVGNVVATVGDAWLGGLPASEVVPRIGMCLTGVEEVSEAALKTLVNIIRADSSLTKVASASVDFAVLEAKASKGDASDWNCAMWLRDVLRENDEM